MDWAELYPAYVVGGQEEGEGEQSVQGAGEGEKSVQGAAEGGKEEQEANKDKKSLGAVRKMSKQVEVADIGCGFGGLLFALAPKLPDTLLLGMPCHFSPSAKLALLLRQTRPSPKLTNETCDTNKTHKAWRFAQQ
jgi:tRNA (guanine-N7-)-methyltransferase